MANPFQQELERRAGGQQQNPFRAALAQQQQASMPWAEVGRQALENLGPSAAQAASDFANVFTSPIETAKGVGNVALGAVQKLIPGEQESEQYADAVGRFFADRYGGLEETKRTLATDPVGAALDASTVLTGGGGALARAPGVAGKVGAVAAKADPLAGAASMIGKGAGRAASEALGWTTGAKGEAVRTAARAGFQGGEMGELFRGAMRGDVPAEQVVTEVRGALENMYKQRGEQYTAGMAGIAGDTKPLSFDGIDAAMAKMEGVGKFKDVDISPSTADVRGQVQTVIDQWKALDPAEYHTVAGMDALKRRIGDILGQAEYGKPEWKVANEAYQAVKREIVKQAPEYAAVMKDYWKASEQLKEIEKALSLGKKASVDTALRKLQSTLRNDVSSAYGHRGSLLSELEDAGAKGVREQLSGQAMSGWVPRGLASVTPAALIGGGAYTSPGMLAATPLMSPRVVGEAAHAAGRFAAGSPLSKVDPSVLTLAYQMGRGTDPQLEER